MSELRVLIAEPSKTGRHIFTQLVKRLGVEVVFTTNAEDTVKQASSQSFQLICLSQKLPDGEGVQVCARLRKFRQYQSTTVLLVTPQKSSINYELAFSSGVTQLIGRHELHRFVHAVELMIERAKPIEGSVLVIEDSRSQADYLSAMLKSMGLKVEIVCSAEQAARELAEKDYSLALMDVVLAGNMTGVELVAYIRTLPEPRNRVRVLATSAFEDPSRRIQLFNLGIDDFIGKPIIREELIARVRGLLSQHYIQATERENQRLSESLNQLMDNSPDLIARYDMNGQVLFMNPQMERELDLEHGQMVGRHFNDIGLPDKTVELYQKAMTQLVDTGQTVRFQITGKSNTDYDVQFSPETCDGKIVSVLGSARDITQLTELQRQLVASKAAVETASDAKSRFLATMSHELRTPLNAISGFQQLIKSKLLNNKDMDLKTFVEYLDLIGENAEHLTTMINEILDLSRIESDKIKAHYQPVRIQPFLEGCRSSFKSQCDARNIRLQLDFSCLTLTTAILDKAKTLTVLNNLIDNAIKFSHFDSQVTIGVTQADESLIFTITDEGVGIPETFMDKLFMPFEQVDNSRTRSHGGTGLGLSIADKFARFLGGKITISSVEGQGTECELRLPIGSEQDAEMIGASNAEAPKDESEEESIGFSGQKILVVEDSLVNQQLMRACLDSCGLQVAVAENGLEAIEQCLRWEPDLVLMDMHMPKMDGLTATTKIRSIAAFADLPIFGLSADAHQDYIDKAKKAGVTAYLTKPVDFNELYRLMDEYLAAAEQEQQPDDKQTDSGPVGPEQAVEETQVSEQSVLNADKGIVFAANNKDLYKQLLSTFIGQYQDSNEQLTALYQTGQNDAAMKLAHTMKGVCSTLGMDSLSELAKKMQFAFANNELDGVDGYLEEYGKLLVIALKEAQAYCDS